MGIQNTIDETFCTVYQFYWFMEDQVVENKVANRFIMTRTHNIILFSVPPTGKSINIQAFRNMVNWTCGVSFNK